MNRNKSVLEGEIYSSNTCGYFEILKYYDYRNITIRFLKTGYEKSCGGYVIKKGRVRDPYYPVLFNIGFVGEGKYNSTYQNDSYYSTWRSMLSRCYNSKDKGYKHYGGKGVTVDERWYNFQNFCDDIQQLEGYDEWKSKNKGYEWQLDKDKKQQGVENKIYSKDTCLFVTVKENIRLQNTKHIYGYVEGIKLFEYEKAVDIEKELNISDTAINYCLRHEKGYAGFYNGKHIVWRFEDDLIDLIYNDTTYEKITKFNGYVYGEIIFKCLTASEAIQFLNVKDVKTVYECANRNFKYGGKYQGKPVVWRYEDDILEDDLDAGKMRRVKGFVDNKQTFEFSSAKEANDVLGILATGIIRCCRYKQDYAGRHLGEPIVWRYFEDTNTNNISIDDINPVIGKVEGNIVYVYKKASLAEKELNIFAVAIRNCCNKKVKSAGKYNGKPIIWEWQYPKKVN